MNFPVSKKNNHKQQFSELYQLDSSYRVVDFKRGELNLDQTAVSTVVNTQSWQLDGVSSWNSTNVDGKEQTQTINNMNE